MTQPEELVRSRAACTHTLLGGGGLVARLCLTLGFSVHGILQGRITEVGCHFLLQGVFLTLVSCIAGGFFTTEPPGKPAPFFRAVYLFPFLI